MTQMTTPKASTLAQQMIQAARQKAQAGVKLVNRERVLLFLADGKPHTGLEIATETNLYRFGAYLKDLRDMGLEITTTRDASRPNVYIYQLQEA